MRTGDDSFERLQNHFENAVSCQRRGDHEGAVSSYLAMLCAALPPTAESAVRVNLAKSLRQLDRPNEAADCLVAATRLSPSDPDVWGELGLALAAAGQPEVAVLAHRASLDRSPSVAGWVNLGNALRDSGQLDEAISAFRTALEHDSESVPALFNLHAAVYRDDAPDESLSLLFQCLELQTNHSWARFLARALSAWHPGASVRTLLDDPDSVARIPEFLETSLQFALIRRGEGSIRLFADTFVTLDWASSALQPQGVVVELGVRHGTSIRYLARRLAQRRIVGFDSFAGLPSAWGDHAPGLYSTDHQLPQVPASVELRSGWFADTLPGFVAELSEPIALVHVDCDVYSSTREALGILAPYLAPGALLVFDDYLANPNWENDEHRALQETVTERRVSVSYLALSFFSRQAVVRWSG